MAISPLNNNGNVISGQANGQGDNVGQTLTEIFAMLMVDSLLMEPAQSPTAAIADSLPGSPANVENQLNAVREEMQTFDQRLQFGRMLARKDDEMAFRS
ncbi:MAG: hypothetical protein MEP57_06740 [Microvirga sp.]|nr:hypothetical protein [Microvirga sp.]